ncbi:hypothetical protein SNEBB_011242 [Seison nebaliae]|nr:hypothetical protein SNEBB_011242 [Seison nebaliae]
MFRMNPTHFISLKQKYNEILRLIEEGQTLKLMGKLDKEDIEQLQKEDKPFLIYAIEKQSGNAVKYLLDRNIILEKKWLGENWPVPKSAYEYAMELGDRDMINLVETRGRDEIDVDWRRTLGTGKIELVVEWLLSHQLNPLDRQQILNSGFFFLVQRGMIQMVDNFLSAFPLNIEMRNEKANTPLHEAIARGNTNTAQFLIFRGADIHALGEYGTPIITTVHYDGVSEDITRLLLDKGADISVRHRDYPNLSLREYCVENNRVKMKQIIDDYIIKLVSEGKLGKLEYLAANGYKQLNVKSKLRRTSRDLAVERNQPKIVKLLDTLAMEEEVNKTKMNYGKRYLQ